MKIDFSQFCNFHSVQHTFQSSTVLEKIIKAKEQLNDIIQVSRAEKNIFKIILFALFDKTKQPNKKSKNKFMIDSAAVSNDRLSRPI